MELAVNITENSNARMSTEKSERNVNSSRERICMSITWVRYQGTGPLDADRSFDTKR